MGLELEEWNRQTIALMQALLGAVSPNFRMVILDKVSRGWKISFVLEHEEGEDREEIDDIITQFEALQDGKINVEMTVTVTSRPLAWPASPARVIYRRRENEL